jgi:hypothetical protein
MFESDSDIKILDKCATPASAARGESAGSTSFVHCSSESWTFITEAAESPSLIDPECSTDSGTSTAAQPSSISHTLTDIQISLTSIMSHHFSDIDKQAEANRSKPKASSYYHLTFALLIHPFRCPKITQASSLNVLQCLGHRHPPWPADPPSLPQANDNIDSRPGH